MSDKQVDGNLTETVGALTSAEDIWLGLELVETGHSAGSGAAAAGRDYWPNTNVFWRYVAQYQRMLEKFGRGPRWFEIFGSGSTSVEDVDALIQVPGVDMPCDYVGSQ